jgi:hypothetical protein
MAVFTFSNRRSMMYTSIDVTPFNECFWRNDGERTIFQMRGSWWRYG